MKLNTDCVRAILLTVEKYTDFNTPFEYEKDDCDYPLLKKYSHNEIIYHIKQCELSNLILGVSYVDGGEYVMVSDLSPEGHQFVANIRKNSIWKKIKDKAIDLGITSLPAIMEIANKVIEKMIETSMNTT